MSELIRVRAIIQQVCKGGKLRCTLQDNDQHEIVAYCCGDMRRKSITLCIGDHVDAELSPYDLTRGRIVWRHIVP